MGANNQAARFGMGSSVPQGNFKEVTLKETILKNDDFRFNSSMMGSRLEDPSFSVVNFSDRNAPSTGGSPMNHYKQPGRGGFESPMNMASIVEQSSGNTISNSPIDDTSF